ncbi:MAG: glycosyltransferase family 4 protein [Deltaproteobacteria bacterium]|nr:glycosyltransferase family 4 protein [Deltaproteobacteria bacterium]
MPPLAQTGLLLFFTRGMSLAQWEAAGLLSRETALYRRLRPHLARTAFFTYGGADDATRGGELGGIQVLANPRGLHPRLYGLLAGRVLPRGLAAGPWIVKTNQVPGGDAALAAARRLGAPLVARAGYLFAEFQEKEHGTESRQARAARRLEARVFRAADRVVLTTAGMAARAQAAYDLAPDKVRVIPNFVDIGLFAPEAGEAATAAARPLVGFVGRLAPQKNLGLLFRAAAGLGAGVLVAGSGPQEAELRELAGRLGLAVEFLGNLPHEELPGVLARCAVYAQPSLYEGHPKALLEAMAAGLAVVGCRAPGVDGLIQDGVTGRLAAPEEESLRAVLAELLGDPGQRAALGSRARAWVAEGYSLEQVVEKELALLSELAEGMGGR